jgi:hypothetical protein
MVTAPNWGAITPQRTIKINELRKKPGIAANILKKPILTLLYLIIFRYYGRSFYRLISSYHLSICNQPPGWIDRGLAKGRVLKGRGK